MAYLTPVLSPRPLLTEGATSCLLRKHPMTYRDFCLVVPPNHRAPLLRRKPYLPTETNERRILVNKQLKKERPHRTATEPTSE